MDHKTTGIIFFLPFWDVKYPTLEDQTGLIISEMFEEDECLKIGNKVFSSNDYHKKDPKEFIREVIRKERPEWVIGVENTANILMSYKRQKKILINPTVTLNDLNWVTPETIRDTYAFFSADYEKDYEIYSKVTTFLKAQKPVRSIAWYHKNKIHLNAAHKSIETLRLCVRLRHIRRLRNSFC